MLILILILITVVFLFILYICKDKSEFMDVVGIGGIVYAVMVFVVIVYTFDTACVPDTTEPLKVTMEDKS